MTVFLWTIALLGCQAADQKADAKQELAQLQGTWQTIHAEEVGFVIKPEEAKEQFFVFKEDSLTVRRKGELRAEFTITLNPGGRKGEIDLKHKRGRYEGKVCHAIYSLEGDVLKICTASKMRADEPDRRPNIFSTTKGDKPTDKPGTLLFILQRQKQ